MKKRDMLSQTHLAAKIAGIIPTEGRTRHHRIASPEKWPGKVSSVKRKPETIPASTHPDRPRISHCLNDNYCVNAPIQT